MSPSEPLVLPALDDAAVETAHAALEQGALVVMPTDTVYGLGCRADDVKAVRRLFAAKGRDTEKALPVLVADADGLSSVCAVTPELRRLAAALWPGPLTVVVAKRDALPDLVTGGKPTVGVRVPDCAPTRALLARCAFPVAVTSANLSGAAPATEIDGLAPELRRQVAVVLDGGRCPGLTPSTVLDLTAQPPRLLRAGPVSAAALAQALGETVLDV